MFAILALPILALALLALKFVSMPIAQATHLDAYGEQDYPTAIERLAPVQVANWFEPYLPHLSEGTTLLQQGEDAAAEAEPRIALEEWNSHSDLNSPMHAQCKILNNLALSIERQADLIEDPQARADRLFEAEEPLAPCAGGGGGGEGEGQGQGGGGGGEGTGNEDSETTEENGERVEEKRRGADEEAGNDPDERGTEQGGEGEDQGDTPQQQDPGEPKQDDPEGDGPEEEKPTDGPSEEDSKDDEVERPQPRRPGRRRRRRDRRLPAGPGASLVTADATSAQRAGDGRGARLSRPRRDHGPAPRRPGRLPRGLDRLGESLLGPHRGPARPRSAR
ncbi:hypothetical protein [Brachybacterium sp. GPGPB12]|uniref:hypothetical protein n=1 Tax=Brachybacterium sp. GPGPB12 TaxID=3023517 RepID=UPI00313434A9